MAGPTFNSRLALPSRLVPVRPLHLTEAEDDFTLLANGLDDVMALLEGITTPFVSPMTDPGDLIMGGVGGAPVRVAPGSRGCIYAVGEDGPEWQAAQLRLPAFS